MIRVAGTGMGPTVQIKLVGFINELLTRAGVTEDEHRATTFGLLHKLGILNEHSVTLNELLEIADLFQLDVEIKVVSKQKP